MTRLDDLSLGKKVGLQTIIGILALALLALGFGSAFESLKINGKLYGQISDSKDLLADILHPPAYILEAHLASFEMLNKLAGQEEQRKRFDALKQQQEDSIAHWKGAIKDPVMLAQVEEVNASASRYFSIW